MDTPPRVTREQVEAAQRRLARVRTETRPVDMDEIRREALRIVFRRRQTGGSPLAVTPGGQVDAYRVWLIAREIARMAGMEVPEGGSQTLEPARHVRREQLLRPKLD